MNKNDILKIDITGYSHDGSGVGRHDRYVLFTPNAAKGDVINCKVIKPLTSYGFGKIEEILTPSPDRIEVDCPVFYKCGGCTYRHITYEAELEAKTIQVMDAMRKALGREVECLPCLPSPDIDRYRNKALIPFGKEGYGFYRKNSHDVVPQGDCLLQSVAAKTAAAILWKHMKKHNISAYDEQSHKGLVRGIFVRDGKVSGQVMVVVIINGLQLPKSDLLVASLQSEVQNLVSVQLCQNTNRTNVPMVGKLKLLWGAESIEDTLSGNSYEISPRSFYQINSRQCEALYQKAAELATLSGKEKLLDLYCGIGTIGLTMAKDVAEVVGVEIVVPAVIDAKKAAEKKGIKNARFIAADAITASESLQKEGFSPDVVTLDPPRKGCEKELLETVAAMQPSRIIYISCNPATLARDCKILEDLGYKLSTPVTPVDMFPRTPHVECVVKLERVEHGVY